MKVKNMDIPIRKIVISKLHMGREILDSDIEELAESISREGQLQQCIVRPLENGFFELLAGNRRFLAQKKIGSKTVRCSILNADERRGRIISLVENLHQKPLKPQERLDALEALKKELEIAGKKKPDKEIATMIGKPVKEVQRDLRISSKLIPSATRALSQGKISMKQADKLSAMSVRDQRKELPIIRTESSEATANRLAKSVLSISNAKSALPLYKTILEHVKELLPLTKNFLDLVDGRDIDWTEFQKDDSLKLLAENLGDICTFVTN